MTVQSRPSFLAAASYLLVSLVECSYCVLHLHITTMRIFFAEPVTGAMVIVKNVDSATVTIEKLTELFPDAEDITVSSQPQSSYLGKLKG